MTSPVADFDLPAVRKSAVKLFARDIDAVLKPHGYKRDRASLWVRKGLFTQTYLELQKSKYGDACFVNIGWKYNWDKGDGSYFDGDRQWRISQLLDDIPRANRLDQLFYTELDGEESPLRAEVVDLIRDLGVPHLKKFHSILDRFRRS
jgi:hypothetical protein